MKYKAFIVSLIVLFTITSCEGLIEVDQPDVIEEDQSFTDANSTRLSMIGLYGLMTDLVEPMFLAGEVRADLVTATQSADSYIKEFSNNSFSPSNPYISPKPFYTLINNVNDFVYEFEDLLDNNEMDSADFMHYKSELVAIRVWTQYQLAKIFGECKYYTHVLGSGGDQKVRKLKFGNELLEQLIADLTFSDTINYTVQTDDLKWQVVRISDFYVNALLGELYMELGDYESAEEKFNEVTRRGDNYNRKQSATRFSINQDFILFEWMDELFAIDWEPTRMLDHVVFMIGFDNKYNQSHELWNWTSSLDYQVAPTDWYTTKFNAHALADLNNIDYRYYSIQNRNPMIDREFSINKYLEDDRPFILTRTARIELLRAYCSNALGETRSVYSRLEGVLERLGLPEYSEDDMPEDSDEALIFLEDIIMDELAYETGFEGHRWYDLMRIAKRRNDPSYLADRVAQKYPEESRDEIREKLLDKKNWYIPVFD